jgi:hypothetical protein
MASTSIVRHDPNFEKLERRVSDLQYCVRELVNELTVRRIPEHRVRNLRQSWILSFLRGEGMHKLDVADISKEPLDDGSEHWSVTFHMPSGVPGVPRFYVLSDDIDPELLLANRLECVLCIAQAGWSTPTRTLQLIEGMANCMERIAAATLD